MEEEASVRLLTASDVIAIEFAAVPITNLIAANKTLANMPVTPAILISAALDLILSSPYFFSVLVMGVSNIGRLLYCRFLLLILVYKLCKRAANTGPPGIVS